MGWPSRESCGGKSTAHGLICSPPSTPLAFWSFWTMAVVVVVGGGGVIRHEKAETKKKPAVKYELKELRSQKPAMPDTNTFAASYMRKTGSHMPL